MILPRTFTSFLSLIGAAALLATPLQAQSPAAVDFAHIIEFEAEDMEMSESDPMWEVQNRPGTSNQNWLIPSRVKSPLENLPATYSLEIPEDGTWYLWARYSVHPVRSKAFTVVIDSEELVFGELPYGETADERAEVYQNKDLEAGNSNLIWTRLPVELKSGQAELQLLSYRTSPTTELFREKRIISQSPAVDAFVLTNDPSFIPLSATQ